MDLVWANCKEITRVKIVQIFFFFLRIYSIQLSSIKCDLIINKFKYMILIINFFELLLLFDIIFF